MGVRLTRYAAALTSSIVVFALIAGGCGGGDENEAREVVDSYLAASEDDSSLAVCELWSPWAKRDALSLIGALDRLGKPCEEAFTAMQGGLFVIQPGDEPDISVESSGDGVVVFAVEGIEGEVEIREFEGEWRLNSICAETECQTAAEEEAAEAPIGG